MEKSKVYFSKNITSENLVKMYEALNKELPGEVAIKVHTGEEGNQNFLRPEFMKNIIERVNGTIVECNTAYEGARNTTDKHEAWIKNIGWDMYKYDILDGEGPDLILDISNGKVLKENHVGKNITNYDSLLVVSHFKGHPMGGYGGALKQLSIGCASSEGKVLIHTGGNLVEQEQLLDEHAEQNIFIEAMAEAASTITNLFKGNIAYINIMCNMSVDCDCCHIAEDPCLKDIGILASTDPVAIDRACIDLVRSSNDEGKEHFLERVESRNGEYIIECANKLGLGSLDYELINID